MLSANRQKKGESTMELDERKKNNTLYIKSDKQVQKQKAEKEAEKPSFFKSIKNFFTKNGLGK